MRRRTNNDINEDEAVDPTTESQKVPSSVSYFNLLIIITKKMPITIKILGKVS